MRDERELAEGRKPSPISLRAPECLGNALSPLSSMSSRSGFKYRRKVRSWWLTASSFRKSHTRSKIEVYSTVKPSRIAELPDGLSHAGGSLPTLLKRLARASLLIVDDLGTAAAAEKPFRDFLEIIDDRQGATLITSQFPVDQWHELIADATVADAILDRLIHNAYRFELKGESMRKRTEQKPPSD